MEVVFAGPYEIQVREYEDRDPAAREVKVRNIFSGISHGTEISHYRGDAIWLHKVVEPDGFLSNGQSLEYPYCYGYEDVTEVIQVGDDVTEVTVGDKICCWIGHRETGIVNLDQINKSSSSIFLPIPDSEELEKYVFVSLGTVALDGVLLGGIRLGESAVVIGQGVVGLLTAQLCKLSGADPVIVVDLVDQRLDAARQFGADHVLNPQNCDVGQAVKDLLGGHGADICFEASGTSAGLGLALRCGTPFPKVVALGMYDGPATDLRLGEEFCRGAGQILHSRSGGYRLGPESSTGGFSHRKWDIVRVNQTILNLLATGRLDVNGLISHRFPLSAAPDAYSLIDTHTDQVTKVIFDLTCNSSKVVNA